MDSRAQGSPGTCEDAAELAVLPSPVTPWKGAPLRVIFTAEKPLDGELSLIAPDGSVAAKSRERHGGPPYFWFAEVKSPAAGTWRATLARDRAPAGCGTITREIAVRADRPPPPSATPGSVWPLRNTWNRATENLFSAWIEKLFDDPLDAAPSWPALHEVLRDRSRNVLFNHLGLGEDEMKIVLRPDCADLPYFLRAYFAFKMGLPFGYSKCSRGGGGSGAAVPAVVQAFRIPSRRRPARAAQAAAPTRLRRSRDRQPADEPAAQPASRAASGSGSPRRSAHYLPDRRQRRAFRIGRTAANDNNTDYYPVALKQETLRPGDRVRRSYGHVLMIVRRVPQSDGAAGVILAVDGQPDGTVARKRFWRGNFLFAQDPALGGPGFKRFRPIVRDKNGALRRLTNDEIAKNPQYADFSLDQSRLGVEDFYDRMDDVMSPEPLDPLARDEGCDHLARRAGEDARDLGRERAKVPEQRPRRGEHAGRRGDLRDDRRVGGFLDAVAGFASVDRDRCGARVSGPRRAAARALRDAEGQERRRREGRTAERARVGACGAQVFVSAQRRLASGRSRSRTWPTARPISRWRTTRTTASNCGGARRPRATRRRRASGMRRRRSARR